MNLLLDCVIILVMLSCCYTLPKFNFSKEYKWPIERKTILVPSKMDPDKRKKYFCPTPHASLCLDTSPSHSSYRSAQPKHCNHNITRRP